MKAGIFCGIVLGISIWVGTGAAQQAARPAAAPAKAAPATQAGKQAGAPASSSDSKRRDPFHTLIAPKKPAEQQAAAMPVRLPPGKKGLVVEQLQLQGIVHGIDGVWIAVVTNNAKRTYFLHEKDELYNAIVTRITADTVVFTETETGATGNKITKEVLRKLASE